MVGTVEYSSMSANVYGNYDQDGDNQAGNPVRSPINNLPVPDG